MAKSNSFDETTLSVDAGGALAALNAAGSAALDLIEQWLKKPNPDAIAQIAEHGSGAARKAARRGVNVLKSRGVRFNEAQRKARLVTTQQREPEALMLAPDSAGVRLLAFNQSHADGSCQASLIYVRDGQGVLQIENSQTTPSRLRTALAQVLPGSGYEAVAVPLAWARHKVSEARRVHKERGLIEPLGFGSAKALLEPVPDAAPEHPFDAEGFVFSDEDAADLAKDSGALHHLPEFRSWLPSQASVQELLTNVGKQLPRDEKPSQEATSELIKAEMLAATDRYFSQERRDDLVQWMKDAGISLLTREGEEAALKVAATIQVISGCGITSNPPQDVAFLRAFFEKAISVLMAQSGGRLDIPLPRSDEAAA